MKRLFRIFSICILVIGIAFCLVNTKTSVFALEIKDKQGNTIEAKGIYTNGDATYALTSEESHLTLEFGLKYVYDKGYVATNKASDIMGYAAGGSAYASSGSFDVNTYYPNEVRFLDIDPSLGIEVIPWTKFTNGKWTLNTVTAMASDFESLNKGYKVIGAVNADFFDISSEHNYNYTTSGSNVCNGNYYKVSSSRYAVGFKDGTLIGNIKPTITEKPVLEIIDSKENVLYSINVDKINSEVTGNEVGVIMAFYDTDHKPIDENVTDAYIIAGDRIAPFSMESIYGIGTVSKFGSGTCNKTTFAIKTNNEEVKSKLEVGTRVRVQYKFTGELADYDNVVGAGDTVLWEGNCVAEANYRHPRTFIGARADGSIILMEVDGRQASKDRYGVTLKEEAAIMKYYGAECAFNLDGGGSSTICILQDGEFKIMNTPSDGHPRSDSNCLLVVVRVPVLELASSEIKPDSFNLKVDILETMEQYKDLYIAFSTSEDEKQKIETGKVFSIKGLNSNSKYTYQVYVKIGEEYFKMPYSGVIQTSKLKYSISNVTLEALLEGEDMFYDISYNMNDVDNTLVNCVLIVNGKRYYASKGHFKVPMDNVSPLSLSSRFEITYNVNDGNGGMTDKVNVQGKVKSYEVIASSAVYEVKSLIDELIN